MAPLAEGSVGRALELAASNGLDYYKALMEILIALPRLDLKKLEVLAGRFAGVKGAAAWPVFQTLFLDALVGLAKSAATGQSALKGLPGEGQRIVQLASTIGANTLVDLWEEARTLFERTDSVNLDRRHAIMSMVYRIEASTKKAA